MRHTFWLVMLMAGIAGGQGRAPSTLARDMVAAHNAERERVHVAPLVWSRSLAAVAQEWAQTLLDHGILVHRPSPKFGENLFEIKGGFATVAQVVDEWAGEARNYDYRSNTCRGECGHYTQIVWAGTQAVGCAVAGSERRQVWVCNYDPHGNTVGQRPY